MVLEVANRSGVDCRGILVCGFVVHGLFSALGSGVAARPLGT